jgi:hypothetical protein
MGLWIGTEIGTESMLQMPTNTGPRVHVKRPRGEETKRRRDQEHGNLEQEHHSCESTILASDVRFQKSLLASPRHCKEPARSASRQGQRDPMYT